MGSHAIRTRRRSPNTLFHFHTCSKKWLPTDLILGSFWKQFSPKIRILSEKRAPKNGSKKGCPPLRKQGARTDYDHGPGLPDSPPRVRAFLNKKQLSEQETRTAAHFWIHFRALFLEWAIFWFHVWRNVHFLMKSETKKTSHRSCFFLWFLSKGPWSDTLWAKARRIIGLWHMAYRHCHDCGPW